MESSRKESKARRTKAQNARPTIGLLTEGLSGVSRYQATMWAGIADAAREQDANLICFAGGTPVFSPLSEFEVQRNVLYDLVASDNVDGLIISSSSLSSFVSPEEFKGFCDRYRSLPMVSVGLALEDIPSALVDNDTGLRDAISHLIEVHGYRRIAFIQGPEDHEEADVRYRVYTEVLAEHGLALNPDLVAPGDFLPSSGAAAMRLLLDDRKLRPGVDFEAIVASNDNMALAALEVLRARGIQVPYDVAVVGFDDLEEARVSTPSLTTVRQPVYEQGKRVAYMLLALLAGEEVPEQVTLPTEMVVRRSCGCHSQPVLQASAEPVAGSEVPPGYSAGETFEEALFTRREEILAAMVQAVAGHSVEAASTTTPEWAEQLLDGFAAEMGGKSPGGFLSTLDQVLRQVAAVSGDPSTSSSAGSPHGSGQGVAAWQGALSALRCHVLPYLSDDEALSRAENLWQQARLFIAEATQQVQRYRQLQAEQQAQMLQEIGQALITTFDVEELMDVIARELPRLGIPSGYLSLYEGQEMPPKECRLILACGRDGRIGLEPGGRRFPSRELVPHGMLPQERCYSMVVKPLYFRDDQLGFVLFETGLRGGAVYEVLRGQISSALQAALLTQRVNRHALQLQTAAEVSSAASGVLDPSQLIQQVVDLARERFDLYYAGLFLVDEARRYAVLQAGTGEAGRQMIEQGHKLEVGGESMIGRCVASGEALIALDVGEEAVRFDNPLLPETRSELALPLTSRGEAIGALTIQSTQEAAFSAEDIAVLQTMAGQVANAIENARLFKRTQAALHEMEAVQRRYLSQAWAEYVQTAEGTHYETERPGVAPLGDVVLPEIQQAVERQSATVLAGDGAAGASHSALVAPITLRGAVIGVLGIHDEDGERQWTSDEIALVEAVAERMALSAENLRLLDETQRRAVRERLTSEVATRIRESLEVETVLRTAAQEVRQALGLPEVVIRLVGEVQDRVEKNEAEGVVSDTQTGGSHA
jgi:DNA-binding LacI/PurR family transcriptional regulator/GAF domain-containing protein